VDAKNIIFPENLCVNIKYLGEHAKLYFIVF
jgi:hypothetical protein